MKKLNKLFAILIAVLGVQTLSATDYITGASNFTVNKIIVSNDNTNGVAREFWSGSENFSFDIYQDIEIPDGVYTFQLQSMYRAHLTKNSITNIALYAHTSGNQYIGRVLNYNEGTVGAEDLGSFNTAFSNDANNYLAKIPYFIVTDGKVKVGVRTLSKTPFCGNGHWFIYNPSSFKLSDVTDSGILTSALNDVKHQAEGLLGNSDNSEAKTNLQDAYDAATATSASIVALKEAVDTYLSYLATNGTEENPNDVSFYFINPKFEGSTLRTVGAVNVYNDGGQPFGWVCYEEAGTGTANQGNALADGMGFNHFTVVDNTVSYDGQTPGYSEAPTGKSLYNRFAWAQWSHSTFSTKQSVTLPAGSYKLSVPAFVSESGTNYDAQIIFTINGNVSTQSLVAKTWKVYETEFILTEQAEISVDLQFRKILASANAGKAYAYFDGVTLLCYGDPIAALLTEISTKKAELEAYDGTIPTALYSSFSDHLTAAANANNTQSESALQEILDNLNADITTANNVVTPYASLKELIDLCYTYAAESYSSVKEKSIRTTFTDAISTATSNIEDVTTAEALNTAYNTLEAARQTFILAAYPTDGNSFDMTFKITNPSFETGDATGWKVINSSDTGVKPNSNATYATSGVDGNYLFNNYWQGTPLTQALSNMPNGIYELKVLVASDGCTVYLIADDEHNEGTDTYTTGKGQFVEATMTFTCTDGNVVIGVVGGANGDASAHKGFTANGYWWYKADNFRLTRTFNTADMQSALTDLLTEANTMASQPMDANIKGELNSTIQATEATATDPATLDNMINALTKAMASAEASINDYAKLKKYIDMTAVFTDVTSYTTKYNNGEYASTNVETTRQELNVLRFEAASLIFPNNIEVTGWEGTMGGKNTGGQHWDGTTGENATKYYDNNSWNGNAHSTTTNITLPAGNYVLKAALRSNENTTLKLTVLNETVNVEGKGDQGYGITINGAASFSPNSTYANDNNGRGWEWEFVKFELADETTVTLTVECDYNGVYGWASFSDITLWMDDATYVTVYGKELEAPLAEARTLFNTLPMGDAENTALANAIAQGEGIIETPAQLNAAVDALKEAVANAKDWRSTYYTEKDKLVAALERFETEFNDGANGALRFIVEWDELLTAVAEAACAKDVLNEHTGLTTAAASLNTVMDAVFGDYLKYEMLEDYTSVIGNADCASNDAWPGSGRDNDTKEHWSGTEKTYFKQNHEDGAARTQTVTLPKSGTYLLKAAVRAVEAASYVDIIINGKSHKIMGAHGRTGGTIATDGTEWESVAAGIEAEKTFANGNKGYGWVYQYIYFDAEVGENTIAISLSNYKNDREANVGGMTLYYLRPNYTEEENNVVKHYGEYNEFVVTTTTHDITAATMSNISVDFTANPNALIFANEGQVSNESNVIINGTANQLSLTDGYAFNATTDFTANAASYGREFTKDTWLTVCLPFAYTIPEGVKVETLGAIDLDTKTFTFDEVKDEMEANKPYIIKNNTEAAALLETLNNVAVKATPAKMDVTITAGNSTHKGEFIGTYTTVSTDDLMEEGAYDILFFGTDGQLYYLSSGTTTNVVTINPFRAYIRLPKDAINWSDGQKARVRHRTSESTDIEDSQSADHDSGLIYDLQGRRVLNPTKGMYIVNGKKVLF